MSHRRTKRKPHAVPNWLHWFQTFVPRWTCEISPMDLGNIPPGVCQVISLVMWNRKLIVLRSIQASGVFSAFILEERLTGTLTGEEVKPFRQEISKVHVLLEGSWPLHCCVFTLLLDFHIPESCRVVWQKQLQLAALRLQLVIVSLWICVPASTQWGSEKQLGPLPGRHKDTLALSAAATGGLRSVSIGPAFLSGCFWSRLGKEATGVPANRKLWAAAEQRMFLDSSRRWLTRRRVRVSSWRDSELFLWEGPLNCSFLEAGRGWIRGGGDDEPPRFLLRTAAGNKYCVRLQLARNMWLKPRLLA